MKIVKAHRIATIGFVLAVIVGAAIIETLKSIDEAVESAWQR